MSSWSSAFDPLPPPPETPESTRKKRKKVKKKKKAKKEPKVKSRKRRRRRRRSSSDEEPVSTRDEQVPRETAREQQVPETTAAFPSSTRPEDQGRWVFQAFWEPAHLGAARRPPRRRRPSFRALFSSLGTKKGIERPAGSLSLGRRSHGISITAKMPGGRVRRTVMMLKRPPPLRSQLPTSGSPKGSRTCKELKRRIRRRIRTMKSTFGLYGPPPRRQPMATRAALNQLLNS